MCDIHDENSVDFLKLYHFNKISVFVFRVPYPRVKHENGSVFFVFASGQDEVS